MTLIVIHPTFSDRIVITVAIHQGEGNSLVDGDDRSPAV